MPTANDEAKVQHDDNGVVKFEAMEAESWLAAPRSPASTLEPLPICHATKGNLRNSAVWVRGR
jgi:hypothetical protein